VAFAVGFADEKAFSRAFKEWTGHSPRDYRRRTPVPR
jgi:AraC-like DNA-binding protein